MSCQKCGQPTCVCGASVLANVQLIDAVIDNPTINGGVQNGPVLNDAQLVGAQLDCTSRGCTAGPGQCNDGIATNAFVCAEVERQIDGGNTDFCQAVNDCLTADPSSLCGSVATCINGTPGIINATLAFGAGARATESVYGVVKYASSSQFNNGACAVAVEACDLMNFWTTPNLASPMWTAFVNAVGIVNAASFNNAALTGTPTAPTAPAGTCTTQISTTAFVCTAIANAISGSNPAFCAAVTACAVAPSIDCTTVTSLFSPAGVNPGAGVGFLGSDCNSYTAAEIVAAGGGGGGGGLQLVAKGILNITNPGTPQLVNTQYQSGCTISYGSFPDALVTFNAPLASNTYQVNINVTGGATAFVQRSTKSLSSFVLQPGTIVGTEDVYFEIYQ